MVRHLTDLLTALHSPTSTDQYLSQYLSGPIDSVKDPLQEQINDNKLTANLTTYMISMGMIPTQAVAFFERPSGQSSHRRG